MGAQEIICKGMPTDILFIEKKNRGNQLPINRELVKYIMAHLYNAYHITIYPLVKNQSI